MQSRFVGKPITVPRRTRRRIAQPARTDDRFPAFVFSLFRPYSYYARHNIYVRHRSLQTDNFFIEQKLNSDRTTGFFQSFGNIARVLGNGKDSSSAFDFKGQTVRDKKFHNAFGRERPNGARKKFSAADDIFQKFVGRNVVGNITASLSRNVDFFSQFFVLFKKKNVIAVFGGGVSRHKSRGASADDAHLFHCYTFYSFDRYFTAKKRGLVFFRFLISL